MASLRMVVFDCDGTIVDSQAALIEILHDTFQEHGLSLPSRDKVLRGVGLNLSEAIGLLLPERDSSEIQNLTTTYKKFAVEYRQSGAPSEPLYPNAKNVISSLHDSGWLLGIATGKSRRGLDYVLNQHKLNDFFITKQTSDRVVGKPNPKMLYNAMSDTGVDASCVFMVGDTTYDMRMAVNAGTNAIGVSWGYHETEELVQAGANIVVHSYDDLLSFLDKIAISERLERN